MLRTPLDRRLERYAAYAVVHGVLVVLAFAGVVQAVPLVLVASLPLLWAWGAFQTHVSLNANLDDAERNLWRIVLWCLPWAATVYWLRHVR